MTYTERLIAQLKQEKYRGVESAEFYADCERLVAGEPFEYVFGKVDFLGATIDLSMKPMIPRPETAFWVARAIEELKQKSGPLRLADTFAGSGNVGVALLKHLPNATVDICELDPALKEQIEKNIHLNNIAPERVRIVTASDIQGLDKGVEATDVDAVREASESCEQDVHTRTARDTHKRSDEEMRRVCGLYDAIFAVPPYVPYDALTDLDQEMIEFEPHLAFFAHDDGHEFHRLLVANAHRHLKDGGALYMEADMDDNDFIRSIVSGTAWQSLEFWPDPYGATPNVVLRK